MGNFFPVYKFCPGSVAPQPTLAAGVPLLCKVFVVGFLAWLRRRAKKPTQRKMPCSEAWKFACRAAEPTISVLMSCKPYLLHEAKYLVL